MIELFQPQLQRSEVRRVELAHDLRLLLVGVIKALETLIACHGYDVATHRTARRTLELSHRPTDISALEDSLILRPDCVQLYRALAEKRD